MTSTRPRNMYTEENLRPAVAAATTLGEVLTNLGLEDSVRRRDYVSQQIKALGIDGAHLRNASILYTDTQVAEAVRGSTTFVEVAEKLGATPMGGTIAHLKRRASHLGLDTSHFKQQRLAASKQHRPTSVGFRRVGRNLVVDEQRLCEAVPDSFSIADVIRRLGLSVTGTRHRLVKAEIERLGLDVSHFVGQGHLRGVPSHNRRAPEEHLAFRPELKYRADSARLKRSLIEVGVPELCAECGIGPEWRGKRMSLQVDHISGDYRDNRRENLRLLCPNCHATTDTYYRKKRTETT